MITNKLVMEEVVNSLIDSCHITAVDKGWWNETPERTFAEQIALMHSELSEALEDYRNDKCFTVVEYEGADNKPCGIASELADVLIRIFDTCGRYDIPLAKVLIDKMEYNKTRPYRHGGKKC